MESRSSTPTHVEPEKPDLPNALMHSHLTIPGTEVRVRQVVAVLCRPCTYAVDDWNDVVDQWMVPDDREFDAAAGTTYRCDGCGSAVHLTCRPLTQEDDDTPAPVGDPAEATLDIRVSPGRWRLLAPHTLRLACIGCCGPDGSPSSLCIRTNEKDRTFLPDDSPEAHCHECGANVLIVMFTRVDEL